MIAVSVASIFGREAVVHTQDGKEINLQNISLSSRDATCFGTSRAEHLLRVYKTDGTAIGVPIENVTRIAKQEETSVYLVVFKWRGATNEVKGTIGEALIIADHSLGRLELQLSQLKQLAFSDSPSEVGLDASNMQRNHNAATFVMPDGKSFSLEDVEVNTGFNSKWRKPVMEPGFGPGTYEWAYASGSRSVNYLEPMIAGQKQTIFLWNIVSAEIKSATDLSVLGKDGTKMDIKLPDENRLVGFNGVSEKEGLVFVPLGKITKVTFVWKEKSPQEQK